MENDGAELLRSCLKPTAKLADLVHGKGASLFYRDPSTGYTPLHAAAEAGAEEQVTWFLENGAPWNQVDNKDFTPAELALSKGHTKVYDIIFEKAVEREWQRFYEPPKGGPENLWLIDIDTRNKDFLKGRVYYTDAREHTNSELDSTAMVSDSGSGVMMEWARPIMKEAARLLFDGAESGVSVLNIGFGLGVIDTYFQSYKPVHHTIVEAHPDALAYMRRTGWYDKPNVRILEGLWQEFIDEDPTGPLGKTMGRFDAIYFDTFEEGYRSFMSFWKCAPGLLRGPKSRMSFFHCHARGNAFAYKVYSEVASKHLSDLGLDTVWNEIYIDPKTVWFSYADAKRREKGNIVREENHAWLIPISSPKSATS